MRHGEAAQRIIVAYDKKDPREGYSLAVKIGGKVGAIKLGLEFVCKNGVPGIERVQAGIGDGRIFVDNKFSDIPNTVRGAAQSILSVNPWMFNVHATAGLKAMFAAREAAEAHFEETGHRTLVIAVTVLTSLDEMALEEIGIYSPPLQEVVLLAKLAQRAGLNGIVASPLEIEAVREACGPDFIIVTPGIRQAGGATHDQARLATPAAAIEAGADYLVIGRAISETPDPDAAIDIIAAEIASVH